MTNFEKHSEQIKELLDDGKIFGVTKDDEVKNCFVIDCDKCKFSGYDCESERVKWLFKEAEKTKKDILREIERSHDKECSKYENCVECPYGRSNSSVACRISFTYDYLKERR